MTSKPVALTKWHTLVADSLDIDWPSIHKEIGEDAVEWLREQEQQQRVIMIIERQFSRIRLAVEFTDEQAATEYWMKFSTY